MNRKELKEKAKAQLKTRWGDLVLVCFLYGLIVSACASTFIGYILLGGPLAVGLAIYMSKFVRTGERKIENMFSGFDDFGGNFVLGLLSSLYIFLWGLLFFIPAIIKQYSYAACFYIKQACPEMSANDCITKSREVMKGHKWELFVVDLSFIGWDILATLSFGIGYLWLIPYIQVTKANYFVQLLRNAGIMPMPNSENSDDKIVDEKVAQPEQKEQGDL